MHVSGLRNGGGSTGPIRSEVWTHSHADNDREIPTQRGQLSLAAASATANALFLPCCQVLRTMCCIVPCHAGDTRLPSSPSSSLEGQFYRTGTDTLPTSSRPFPIPHSPFHRLGIGRVETCDCIQTERSFPSTLLLFYTDIPYSYIAVCSTSTRVVCQPLQLNTPR